MSLRMPELEGRVLLEVGRAGGDGCSWATLLAALGHGDQDDQETWPVLEVVRELVRLGRIVERGDQLRAIDSSGLVAGQLGGSSKETEVIVEWPRAQHGRRLVVSWRHRKGARHGDRVLARPIRGTQGRPVRRTQGSRHSLSSASVLSVLERSADEIVGRLERVEGRFRFEPFLDDDRDAVYGLELAGDEKSWRDDEWVLAKIVRRGGWTPTGLTGARRSSDALQVASRLGRLGEPGVDAQIVAIANGIPTTFPNAVIGEVRNISGPGEMTSTRQDLRALSTVTIDGETARDFDDAITVTRLEETSGFRLWVHIADVSHFVRPGGALDEEATLRGTSVYLQETVVPMLPARLSDDLCSLRPHEDRFAVSVQMDFDDAGLRLATECCESVIRSDARLTYDDVADFLGGSAQLPATISQAGAEVRGMLESAGELMKLLNRKRMEEGSLEFDLPTSPLRFDARARIAGTAAVRLASHRLIEEFMLEANTAVAELLDSAQQEWALASAANTEDPSSSDSVSKSQDSQPEDLFLYRVHQGLSRDGVDEIEEVFELRKTRDAQERIAEISRLAVTLEGDELRLLGQLTLRALERATYEPHIGPHRALGKSHYCHFTSPIRRYPDLVMHRRLKEVLGLVPRESKNDAPGKRSNERVDPKSVARECSRTERRAERAERELRRWRVLRHLASREGSVHRGLVTGVGKPGLFVQLTRLGVDGLVSLESLLDDHYLFEDDGVSLVGRSTGRRFRMGDEIRVRVAEVDQERRWLQLTVVGLDSRLFSRSRPRES